MKKLLVLILTLLSLNSFCQITSAKSGKWSDPNTWTGKKIPKDTSVIISHTVTLDGTQSTKDITVNSTLKIDNTKPVTITINGNIINYGSITGNTTKAVIIKFTGIDESQVMGAIAGMGMDIETAAHGIWGRGKGTIDIQGVNKTAWLNCLSVNAGDTKLLLKSTPKGWTVGDTLSVTATLPITDKNFAKAFDLVCIKSISGRTVTLTKPVVYSHPGTPEVLNITRNIRIQNGHIHIMTSTRQVMRNVALINMGISNKVGRYPLHFHHCADGSAGSLVEGVVVYNSSNRAFVFHASDKITARNCIAYGIRGPPYWYDLPPTNLDSSNNSNGLVYDSLVAALITPDESPYRFTGFEMGAGRGNSCKNCISCGNQSLFGNGFDWPEAANHMQNVWEFRNCTSHNNAGNGIFIWQNDNNPHVIKGLTCYNNGNAGIEQGAYINRYKFDSIRLSGNRYGIYLHALSVDSGMFFTRVISDDSLYIASHTLGSTVPVTFINCSFPGITIAETAGFPGIINFNNCKTGGMNIISKKSEINIKP